MMAARLFMGGATMTNRPVFLAVMAAVIAITVVRASTASVQTTLNATPVTAAPPAWSVTIYQIQDPYGGLIVAPATTDPTLRYVGIELGIANNGVIPLTVAEANIRVHDAQGFEYNGGSVFGTQPRLRNRTLGVNEIARGWIWIGVPTDAVLTQVSFFPSASEFRVAWDQAPVFAGVPITPTTVPTKVPTPSPTAIASPVVSPVASPS
jgi:hypothetical protein